MSLCPGCRERVVIPEPGDAPGDYAWCNGCDAVLEWLPGWELRALEGSELARLDERTLWLIRMNQEARA